MGQEIFCLYYFLFCRFIASAISSRAVAIRSREIAQDLGAQSFGRMNRSHSSPTHFALFFKHSKSIMPSLLYAAFHLAYSVVATDRAKVSAGS